jgi:hypothetical protein
MMIKWGGPLDEIGKTEAPCHSRPVRHDKDQITIISI